MTTEDGRIYESRWEEHTALFEVVTPHSDRCDPANNATNYEFRVTLNSPKANRSIAMCGLFYQSVSESFTEHCYTERVAWITIPDEASATSLPPTTDPTNASPTSSSFKTTETEEPNSSFSEETSKIPLSTNNLEPTFGYRIQIPGEATIVVIIVATLITIVALVLLVFLIILCKSRQRNSCRTDVENDDHSQLGDLACNSDLPTRVVQEPIELLDVSQSTQAFMALTQQTHNLQPLAMILENNNADEPCQQDIVLPNMTDSS